MLSKPLIEKMSPYTTMLSHRRYLPLGEDIQSVILQPTNFCNVRCKYCYLANKDQKQHMSIDVARCVARGLFTLPHSVNLVWHSGEPLTTGIYKMSDLFLEFKHLVDSGKVHHAIQTNATLIDNQWCDFFRKYEVAVSVSIDGPDWANSERVDRNDVNIFSRCIRGIEYLKKNSIPFNVICVVTEKTIEFPAELFQFFVSLGCKSVGFNIVEQDGAALVKQPKGDQVRCFWRKLFDCWKKTPAIDIREFRKVFNWLEVLACNNITEFREMSGDLIPTISFNGELRVLSPELSEISSEKYSNFVIGNVVDTEFSHLIKDARQQLYYKEFNEGRKLCYKTCDYFS